MIFSDIYKGSRSPLAKLRHQPTQIQGPLCSPAPAWLDEEFADLMSRDKTRQKEAVKSYLAAKVKTDWVFNWPPSQQEEPAVNGPEATAQDLIAQPTKPLEPGQDEIHEDPGYQVDDAESDADEVDEDADDDDAQSTYSTVSEDPLRYRPRMEWTSDLSDDELPHHHHHHHSPFHFDHADSVRPPVDESILLKRAQRRREVRKEIEWNEGLACFEARRDAWTGARTVRVRAKPVSPAALSPRSPRRFFFRRSMSGSPPSSTHMPQLSQGGDGSDGSSLARSEDKELRKQHTKDSVASTPLPSQNWPVETLIPLAQPLLPPNNPMRATITPSVYLGLYEKIIIHNLLPSCPINLADMLRACVTGWKRDGEWPPRPVLAPLPVARKKKKPQKAVSPPREREASGNNIARRMSFGLIGRDKDEEAGTGKGIRRSLQRALGFSANGAQNTPATAVS